MKDISNKKRFLVLINQRHNSSIHAKELLLHYKSALFKPTLLSTMKAIGSAFEISCLLLKNKRIKEFLLSQLRIISYSKNLAVIAKAITMKKNIYINDVNNEYYSVLQKKYGDIFILIKNGANCTEKERLIRKIYPFKTEKINKSYFVNYQSFPTYDSLSKPIFVHGYKKGSIFGYHLINLIKDLIIIYKLKREFKGILVLPHPSATLLKIFFKESLHNIKTSSFIITNSKSCLKIIKSTHAWSERFRELYE